MRDLTLHNLMFAPSSLAEGAVDEFAQMTASGLLLPAQPDEHLARQLLVIASEDLEDAERGDNRDRVRFILAMLYSRSCGEALACSYGFRLVGSPVTRSIALIQVFQRVFSRTPEARLGAAFAKMWDGATNLVSNTPPVPGSSVNDTVDAGGVIFAANLDFPSPAERSPGGTPTS